MRLTRIFVSEESGDGLWSIHLDGEPRNEFDKFFDSLNDLEWLYNFFQENEADLYNGFWKEMPLKEAALSTLREVQKMEKIIYDCAGGGFADPSINLQHLFKPLNNFEYVITLHQKSKARIGRGWIRLYAIRLSENCYLVTGGAIKLTWDMKRAHLQSELRKLDQTKIFLQINGIDYPEDLNTCQNE